MILHLIQLMCGPKWQKLRIRRVIFVTVECNWYQPYINCFCVKFILFSHYLRENNVGCSETQIWNISCSLKNRLWLLSTLILHKFALLSKGATSDSSICFLPCARTRIHESEYQAGSKFLFCVIIHIKASHIVITLIEIQTRMLLFYALFAERTKLHLPN